MFYNFEGKKKNFVENDLRKKKFDFIIQNACVKIFVHKDFFCFLKGILCVFITAS